MTKMHSVFPEYPEGKQSILPTGMRIQCDSSRSEQHHDTTEFLDANTIPFTATHAAR